MVWQIYTYMHVNILYVPYCSFYRLGYIFWTNTIERTIKRAWLNGTNTTTIVSGDIGNLGLCEMIDAHTQKCDLVYFNIACCSHYANTLRHSLLKGG